MMAATAKRKPAKKKPAKKSARKEVASAPVNGQAAKVRKAPSDKFATNQKPLDTMADVDERVPELDEVCQTILSARDKRRSLKDDVDESLGQVKELLEEHNLDCYILHGNKFFVEPSSVIVKIKKVKQQ